ncbi:uncharacterized protein SCO1/SenC/PrrC [Burkholderiales bacterium JOSHI_001]|nr:uncharacterized protein SCO1/SenC/PrrC [Burkholderiales bacterium JOSHI_001]
MTPITSRAALAAAALGLAFAANAQHDHHSHGAPAAKPANKAAAPAAEEDHSQHMQAMQAKPAAPKPVKVALADTALVDQFGKAVKLKSDAVGERIVVVDFIYTNCTTVCPVNSALLAQVQKGLGARVGKDVALLSLSVDPVRDTPARLKDYSAKYGTPQGWQWLTGSKPQVDEALKAFDAWTPNFVEHPAVIMVGDGKSGKWLRFFGFASPEQITDAVKGLLADRAKTGGQG